MAMTALLAGTERGRSRARGLLWRGLWRGRAAGQTIMCGTLPPLSLPPLSLPVLMIGPLGMQEMLIILVVALIVFGPRKLPQIGKTLGKSVAEFRRTSTELRSTLEREVQMEEFRAARTEVADLKKDMTDLGTGLDPAAGAGPSAGTKAGRTPATEPVAGDPGSGRASSASKPESETAAATAATEGAERSHGGNGAASDGEAAEPEPRGDSGK